MPHRNSSGRLFLRLLLFTLAGWVVWALGRNSAKPGLEAKTASAAAESSEPTRARAKQGRFSKRRLATTLAFTTLFFAGAAFTAGAGDSVACELETLTDPAALCAEEAGEDSTEATSTEATSEEPAADESAGEATGDDESGQVVDDQSGQSGGDDSGPVGDDQSEEAGGGGETADETGDPAEGAPEGETPDDSQSGGSDDVEADPTDENGSGSEPDPLPSVDEDSDEDNGPDAGPGSPAHAGDGQPASGGNEFGVTSAEDAPAGLEFDNESGYGVVWLHRTLPDPTPPAKRLSRKFAVHLLRQARANHVDWALVLGVLRAQGRRGTAPATAETLDRVASKLRALRANADEWRAVLALSGRTAFADRAVALTHYNHAVGLRALIRGLQSQRKALEKRVLKDERIDIYPGGRDDVANHRINVRVLVLMRYLAECHGQVTVSSLDSGHGLYARPGVVSAHKYGLAVDIAAVEDQSILGHQQAGGLTEQAVRNVLLLPVELRPKQVISLLGLGGPSFPLADHYDHIHVGY